LKVAYFDCFSGASGDMILGALIHAGLDAEALERELRKLPLDDWHLHVELVRTAVEHQDVAGLRRHHIAATRVAFHDHHGTPVDAPPPHEHPHPHPEHAHESGHSPHRHLSDILSIIRGSTLDDAVKTNAERIFDRLADAEANAHRIPKEEIHFHEVGALDAILDIVGACVGLHLLDVEEVYVSPMPVGRGFVRCAHGLMPVPVPGTMELLRGVPVVPTEIEGELVTPTGAAILTTLARSFGPIPEMTVEAVGYGAGTRDLAEQPNMLRLVLGKKKSDENAFLTDSVVVLETNLDDQSPETFGYLLERLLAAGALDASFTPIVMKKGRPAYCLTVLSEPEGAERLTSLILRETTTFGVRTWTATRRKLQREFVHVETPYGTVRMKVGRGGDVFKIAPEYEDCRRCAEASGAPIREVYEAALFAYRSRSSGS